MPPKKSSAGRPRRASRVSARKSIAKPHVDELSVQEATDSSPQTTPGNSSVAIPSVEEAPVAATATITSPSTRLDGKECQFPPPSVVPTSDGSVPTKDSVSEAQSSMEIESAGEPSNAAPLPTNNFKLRLCEQNPKTCSETVKFSASPQPEQNPENENDSLAGGVQDVVIETAKDTASGTANDKIPVSPQTEQTLKNELDSAAAGGQNSVIETAMDTAPATANDKISASPHPEQNHENENDSVAEGEQDTVIDASTAPDTADVGAIHSTGGKAKKLVKKKVKVVKKIIKRVPKRVVKGTLGSKVDELAKHTVIGDAMQVDASPSVPASLDADYSVSLKVEEPCKSASAVSSEAVKFVEKKDDREAPDRKGSALMDDKNDCSDDQNDKEVIKQPLADSSNAIAIRDGECGAQSIEMEVKEEVKDGGDGARGEDEMGEPILFSGEMEAMERRKRRKTEIFVGGLDKNTEEEDIRKVFEQVGEVLEVRLLRNGKTGKNKGYAFLRYASAADAKKALEKFSKVEICGKQCGAAPVEGNDTIFLGNIDKNWKDVDIYKLLVEIGIEKIDKVTVMANPSNAERNRGFAFVEFETSKDAQIAFKRLQENDVVGKKHKLKVAWAQPLNEVDEQEMLKVKTIYAEFIPSSWDEGKVRDAFQQYGEIDNVVLARNLRTSKRKDFAFINYKTREAAISCIESFNREFSNDDEDKANMKVSLAKPMQKGKQPKQVVKPVKKVPKVNPKPNQSNKRSMDSRNKERLNVPHYGAHRADTSSTSTKLIQLSREQAAWKQLQMGPSRGEFGVPRYEVHRAESSSRTAELVQLVRDQAAWKQPQMGPSRGPAEPGYPNPLPGRKRPFLAMEADPLHSDISRYPYPRLEQRVPVPAPSYNPSTNPSGATYSLSQHQRPAGYESRLFYGSRDYPGNEIRDRTYGSNLVYRRY